VGYEVIVKGNIDFFDLKGFKNKFPYNEIRDSEVGLHGDFAYFFTKVWGDKLEKLKKSKIKFHREGKWWYDENKAVKFLSKYATFKLKFIGEDGNSWEHEN